MKDVYGLERKQKRDLFQFCFADPQFYENLSRYTVRLGDYAGILGQLLRPGWTVERDRIWYRVMPRCPAIPGQGFKIHVSAARSNATEILLAAAKTLMDAAVPFKVVVDPVMLDFVNSKNYPRAASGKFITAYPSNTAEFSNVIDGLHAATQRMSGPFILSDRPYRDSRVVFYRYGSFVDHSELTIYGDRDSVMVMPDGRKIPDLRGPFFQLPDAVADPFPGEQSVIEHPIVLRERYEILEPIMFSNAGGVYKARDRATSLLVIIKEARPMVSYSGRHDAISVRRNERDMLEALQDTNCAPKLVDYFAQWDHEFLVEEYLEDALSLAQYRGRVESGLLPNRQITREGLLRFCSRLHNIVSDLLAAVRACHDRGIFIGDISSDNLLIHNDHIKLIDLEGASRLGSEHPSGSIDISTIGHVSPSRLAGHAPRMEDDYYAVGSVIYNIIFPIQPFADLEPGAMGRILEEIVADYGLPREIYALVTSLWAGDLASAESIMERGFTLPPPASPRGPGLFASIDFEQTVAGIADHLLATAEPSRTDRLWPADYRVFSTNPLSLSFGALGPALFLKETLGKLPSSIENWILGRPISCDSYPPGLYIGMAGIAWGLFDLGYHDVAVKRMRELFSSPLLWNSWDLFYGVAGIGLASLYFASQTGHQWFLDRAIEIGKRLASGAEREAGQCWWRNIDDAEHYGLAHGASGIALFLLQLSRATGDSEFLRLARAAIEREMAAVTDLGDMVVWTRANGNTVQSPYWRYGNAGIGSVLIRFYAELGDERFRHLAEKAARYAAIKYTVFSGQFGGLSGIGEFLLDMYNVTGESRYLDDARRSAEGVLLFRVKRSNGIAFPGEELMRMSADFGTGSSGIGMFLRRLQSKLGRRFHDFDIARLDKHVTVSRFSEIEQTTTC